ncbi:ATP-dependent Clp protease proteolytic subunit [Luteolibacter sp. AS25]|uniref:ATP-dependent Clp protease proteolytic subunit n=1 Tax=Luteolibacter sp. AS25 TaxID=3135776 RepID=UPI00398BB1FA
MRKFTALAFLGIGLQTVTAKEIIVQGAEKSVETTAVTEVSALEEFNKLEAQKLTKETNDLRAEVQKLKLEREAITERLALEKARKDEAELDSENAYKEDLEKLKRESEISQIRAEKVAADFKTAQSEAAMKVLELQSEIETIETAEKRDSYANADPVFLENPLRDDGILVVSDRRIPLNGVIMPSTADFVTSRIDYWNNRDSSLPIFIVIDDCPGGSVMAGYRILKAMEASEAPIHVVVKSFAASMAACITTLAEESYAYPNAIILHHQISAQIMFMRLNLTQQKEFYEESEKWWKRLAKPVAEKMGISTDDFIQQMYEKSTSGDWSEFGDEAKKLKWVNHIVGGIVESSITQNPDSKENETAKKKALVEEVDQDGKVFSYLNRLNPKDVYFLYNPDGYYRLR